MPIKKGTFAGVVMAAIIIGAAWIPAMRAATPTPKSYAADCTPAGIVVGGMTQKAITRKECAVAKDYSIVLATGGPLVSAWDHSTVVVFGCAIVIAHGPNVVIDDRYARDECTLIKRL